MKKTEKAPLTEGKIKNTQKGNTPQSKGKRPISSPSAPTLLKFLYKHGDLVKVKDLNPDKWTFRVESTYVSPTGFKMCVLNNTSDVRINNTLCVATVEKEGNLRAVKK